MRSRPVLLSFVVFFLLIFSFPSAKAYTTAWCSSCHQFLVVNDGVFAYNGSVFEDLTWELRTSDLSEEEFLDFIQTLGVANAGNLTLIYSFPYDMLYMAVYNGTLPVVMKPVLNWYVGGVRDFVKYNGSIFFVASTGMSPHTASDEVYRLDLETFRITGGWDLSWDARDKIAPDNAGLTPYAWVSLGLDDRGRLWARVDMVDPNTTVYYLYNDSNFVMVNSTPVLRIPKPNPPFRIEVRTGVLYNLPWLLPVYTPTEYVLIKNGTEKDVTGELLAFAYHIKPFSSLYGFWDNGRKEWVVSFNLYGLPVTYAVNETCRKPLVLRGLPLGVYDGSYILLGNGTLSWRNHTVRTPKLKKWEDSVELEIYQRDGHPIIVFPWRVNKNGTSEKGFLAYEVTSDGFVVFNTTDERDLGMNMLPNPLVLGDGWNNVTGTLVVNAVNKTAYLITDTGKIPVNFSVAMDNNGVAVGNGTFLIFKWDNVYIVPPYDKPVDVLSLPLCGQKTAPKQETSVNTLKTASTTVPATSSSNSNGLIYIVGIVLLILFVSGLFIWRGRRW
ncbi:hypothetical protein [Thermococcus sp.]